MLERKKTGVNWIFSEDNYCAPVLCFCLNNCKFLYSADSSGAAFSGKLFITIWVKIKNKLAIK
jgi:hypothetical protein